MDPGRARAVAAEAQSPRPGEPPAGVPGEPPAGVPGEAPAGIPGEAPAGAPDATVDPDAEALPPVPWHLKLLLGAVALYLGWRAFQGVEWVVRQL
ncbi:MAG: hypothetical protein AMXMBFR46_03100 [Acidimicrobiia bacterium]